MKTIVSLIGLISTLAITNALAWERVLLDTYTAPQNWEISSQDLGLKPAKPFSVRMRTLHGGRQEGVCIVDIDTGAMKISVVPTRGMNVLETVAGNVRIGWKSPVSEVVNPAFIELNGRGGLGWLEGFNEMVVRCGYEWVGHPGMDKGVLLPLHGLAANIPASKVVLSIDEEPPYTIRLKGELKEQAFKLVNFVIATELSTEPGAQHFSIHDTLNINGDYPKEYEALYHSNFGPPLLDPGAGFSAPVQQVSPFNERAVGEGLPAARSPSWIFFAIAASSSQVLGGSLYPYFSSTASLHATTTKQSSMSCLTATKTARHWQFCITQPATLASVWASISSNCQSFLYGKTPTLWGRDMSRAWNPAPAGPTTAAISVR